MGNVVNSQLLNSECRSWDDLCKLSCVQKPYFHAVSGAASISAPKSKQKTASVIKMSLRRWQVLVPPVQPGGWGLKICPDTPPPRPPIPLTALMAMFPPKLISGELWVIKPSWDLGGGCRDTGWHNSPLSCSPCQHGSLPSLSTSSGRFLSSGPALSRAEPSWAEPGWAGADW